MNSLHATYSGLDRVFTEHRGAEVVSSLGGDTAAPPCKREGALLTAQRSHVATQAVLHITQYGGKLAAAVRVYAVVWKRCSCLKSGSKLDITWSKRTPPHAVLAVDTPRSPPGVLELLTCRLQRC